MPTGYRYQSRRATICRIFAPRSKPLLIFRDIGRWLGLGIVAVISLFVMTALWTLSIVQYGVASIIHLMED